MDRKNDMDISKTKYSKTICFVSVLGLMLASSEIRADDQSVVSKSITETTKEFLSDPARTGSLVGSIIAGSAVANPLAPLLGSVAGFIIGKSSAFSQNKGSAAKRLAHQNRSLIPDDGSEIVSITGISGNLTLPVAETATLSSINETTFENRREEIPKPLVAAAMPWETTSATQSEPSRSIPVEVVTTEITRNSSLKENISAIILDVHGEPEAVLTSEHDKSIVVVELPGAMGTRNSLQKQLASECKNVSRAQPVPMHCYYFSQ